MSGQKATQAVTLARATRHRDHYTLADLEFIEAFADLPNAELAEALGRSLYAIWSAKTAIRKGTIEARARRAQKPVRLERAYTGLPGDEFPWE